MERTKARVAAIAQQMAVPVFSGGRTEPTLAELFSDPITHALMTADRVEYGELEKLLRAKRAQLDLRRGKKFTRSAIAQLKALGAQLRRLSME
jgi:hypothetical protein